MPTPYDLYHALVRGQIGVLKTKSLRIPLEDGLGGGMAAFENGSLLEKLTFPIINPRHAFDTNAWVQTLTGTAAAVARAPGGILMTPGSTSTFVANLQSIDSWAVPAAGPHISAIFRVQLSDVTKIGFSIGLSTVQTDPATTDYTDGIYLQKAPGAAPVVGRVRGASGVAAASASLVAAANGIDIKVGFMAVLDPVNPYGSWYMTGTETPFTAAQNAQLAAILTNHPALFLNINAKGSNGVNPTMLVEVAKMEIGNVDPA